MHYHIFSASIFIKPGHKLNTRLFTVFVIKSILQPIYKICHSGFYLYVHVLIQRLNSLDALMYRLETKSQTWVTCSEAVWFPFGLLLLAWVRSWANANCAVCTILCPLPTPLEVSSSAHIVHVVAPGNILNLVKVMTLSKLFTTLLTTLLYTGSTLRRKIWSSRQLNRFSKESSNPVDEHAGVFVTCFGSHSLHVVDQSNGSSVARLLDETWILHEVLVLTFFGSSAAKIKIANPLSCVMLIAFEADIRILEIVLFLHSINIHL